MRILLIDDHKLIVEGIKNSLSNYMTNVVIDVISDLHNYNIIDIVSRYDILILDINLNKGGDMDGLSLAKKILDVYPEKKICFLTGFDLPGYENEARRIGAYGFISKKVGIEELVNTIKMIMQGETVFPTKRIWLEELTEKEREILELYCHGHSRKDITYILGISMRTLANHLNVIYEKLDVSNYQEMVQKAIRMGYLLPKGEE